MRAFKTFLILSHRYIGIPISFMFVLWFVSGFFMIYTGGMPKVTPNVEIDGAQPIDFSRVSVTPEQVVDIAGFDPSTATLRNVLGRPVYDVGGVFVYADSGQLMDPLTQEQSEKFASEFLDIPQDQFEYVETLEDHTDQWTFTSRRELPLHKFAVGDGSGTEVYVSPDRAAVSVYTTTQSRALAWLGTIPHWLYFEGLRDNQPLWYGIIVWSSAIGCISAILGLFLGVTQFRKVRPFELKRAIPYRGLMRWHYILGCVFGVFTLTWVFSGLLSMEPWAWTNASGVNVSPAVYSEGELTMAEFPNPARVNWQAVTEYPVKEIEFTRVLGKPYFLAAFAPVVEGLGGKRDRLHQPYNINGQLEASVVMVDAVSGNVQPGFDPAMLAQKLDAGIEDAEATEYAVLDEYDDYYYSRGNQLPLPVLRVKFNDPAESWIYVDPDQAQLLTMVHKYSRVERWLYNGLHSLDFAFWYHRRPLWDIGVLTLMSGGLAISLLGLYFGVRRLKTDVEWLLGKLTGKKTQQELSQTA